MSSMDDCFSRFHYHRLSSEESNNVLIPKILELGKFVDRNIQHDILDAIITISYGKRLISTGDQVTIHEISRKDVIELVDVDPVKQQVLYFGSTLPSRYIPLVYMVMYAKKEIQCLVFITFKEDMEKYFRMPSVSHISGEKTFMDLLKSVLTSLQSQDQVIIDNTHLMMTGPTIQRIEKLIEQVGETIEDTRPG